MITYQHDSLSALRQFWNEIADLQTSHDGPDAITLLHQYRKNAAYLTIAMTDARVVGCMVSVPAVTVAAARKHCDSLRLDPRRDVVRTMVAVHEGYRGAGIAKAMHELARDAERKRGVRNAIAYEFDSADAEAFFAKCFGDTGRVTHEKKKVYLCDLNASGYGA